MGEVPTWGEHLRRMDDYFVPEVVFSSWPAMRLRSFGYSTISIRRFEALPCSVSFEARGWVSA